MPVFHIPDDELVFPHPKFAEKDGLLGIGGDLSPNRLLLAYQNGIFPWFSESEPIMWWSLIPRLILLPASIIISHSMKTLIHARPWRVSINEDFNAVIQSCARIKRKGQQGTWINKLVYDAFIEMHQLGFAHSVEVWEESELIGGLYGLTIGKMFCGESMFASKSNASKYAFIHFVKWLKTHQFDLIDCQQDTPHLKRFGAELYSGTSFFDYLEKNKKHELSPVFWNVSNLENESNLV